MKTKRKGGISDRYPLWDRSVSVSSHVIKCKQVFYMGNDAYMEKDLPYRQIKMCIQQRYIRLLITRIIR